MSCCGRRRTPKAEPAPDPEPAAVIVEEVRYRPSWHEIQARREAAAARRGRAVQRTATPRRESPARQRVMGDVREVPRTDARRLDHPADAPAVRTSIPFVTTLTDSFAPGLVCLLRSLKDRSAVPWSMRVIYLDSISADNRARIEAEHPVEWIDRRELAETPKLTTRMPRLAPNFNKLLLWHLPTSDELVFIDADTLCVGSLEQLLTWRPLTAVPTFAPRGYQNTGPQPEWNSGVFCFQPDPVHAAGIVELANKTGKTKMGDQEILNRYWRTTDAVRYAGYGYNFRTHLGITPDGGIRILHFGHTEKPWLSQPRQSHQRNAFALWESVRDGRPEYDRYLTLKNGR